MTQGAQNDRLCRLRRSLADRLGDPRVEVEPYRDGVDCWVDLVRRPSVPPAVVRSAKAERYMTRYEGLVDFGASVEKEVLVAHLLRNAAVPTPAVLAWHYTADPEYAPSWMLLEFIEHTPVDRPPVAVESHLGQIARRIHTINPSGADLAMFKRSQPWGDWICERIMMRIGAAATYVPVPPIPVVERALRSALSSRDRHARALLHLDLRGPNLAIRDDRIVGVFDFGNAIVGDPYLELARIRSCNLLSLSFLQGYGEEPLELERCRRTLDAYELDVTALLVVVSREEFNDPELHTAMVTRTATLLERITADAWRSDD